MASNRRSVVKLVALGVLAGVAAYALTSAIRPSARRAPADSSATLRGHSASFELHPDAPLVTMRSHDRSVERDVSLALLVDGTPHPVVLAQSPRRADPDTLVATATAVIADVAVEFPVELRVDASHDTMAVTAGAPPAVPLAGHTFALQADVATDGQPIFVAGVGPVADRATVAGNSVTLDTMPHPIAIASAAGPISVDAMAGESQAPGEPIHVTVTSPTGESGAEPLAEIDLVVGASSAAVWRDLAEIAGDAHAPVHGRVTGTTDARAGLRDATPRAGRRCARRRARAAPSSSTCPRPSSSGTRRSTRAARAPLVPFVPGTPRDLVLDVSPGGDLHVTVRRRRHAQAADRAPPRARHRRHARPELRPRLPRVGRGPRHRRAARRRGTPLPVGPLPRRRDQGDRVEHRRQGRRRRAGADDRGRARAAARRPHARRRSAATSTSTRARASTRR